MSKLAEQQRGLLAIIKGRPLNVGGDAWLQRVAGSREAAMVSGIALWWRRFQIESQCRYTSRLLKRMGCYEAVVAEYFQTNSTSPYIEEMTEQFLRSLSSHSDSLVAAVAAFELACLRPSRRSLVLWDRHPEQILRALDDFADLPEVEHGYAYAMELGTEVPGSVVCRRLMLACD